MLVLVAAYLLFVKYGTSLMKDREPFDLKYFMIAYNFGLVILSLYISSEVSLYYLEITRINCADSTILANSVV